jgi:hypothetical protein
MSKRKKISVVELVSEVNRLNRESHKSITREMRLGWNNLAEHFLHQTGNYKGFGYLTQDEVPAGEKAGIIRAADPAENTFPDDSRVQFFLPN